MRDIETGIQELATAAGQSTETVQRAASALQQRIDLVRGSLSPHDAARLNPMLSEMTAALGPLQQSPGDRPEVEGAVSRLREALRQMEKE